MAEEAVLIEEGDQFVDAKIRQHQFPVGERGSAGLTREAPHFGESFRIGDHIHFLEWDLFPFQVGDRVDAPGASGFDVDDERFGIVHGKNAKRVSGRGVEVARLIPFLAQQFDDAVLSGQVRGPDEKQGVLVPSQRLLDFRDPVPVSLGQQNALHVRIF